MFTLLSSALTAALATVLAAAHTALTDLGAAPDDGLTWALAIAAVVVAVRTALLPLAVHGVRQAHRSALARPHLTALARRYRDRRDADGLRGYAAERRALRDEHRLSRLGILPLLLQLPVWWALYHLLTDVAGGAPVGALGLPLVASFGAATLLGVPLAARGYLGGGLGHLAVAGGLALMAATLAYVTQRFLVAPNTVLADVPEAVARTQAVLPAVSAAGVLLAGAVVPTALLVYWVTNATWTLAQQAVVTRWFPTPGSPAAHRWSRPAATA